MAESPHRCIGYSLKIVFALTIILACWGIFQSVIVFSEGFENGILLIAPILIFTLVILLGLGIIIAFPIVDFFQGNKEFKDVISILILAIPLFLILLLVNIWHILDWQKREQLLNEGITVPAKVINYEEDRYQKIVSYHVTYHFCKINSVSDCFTHKQKISKKFYGQLKPGSSIIVVYLSANPKISDVKDNGIFWIDTYKYIILEIMILLIGLSAGWGKFFGRILIPVDVSKIRHKPKKHTVDNSTKEVPVSKSISYLNLLLWLFFTPQRLRAYQKKYGENSVYSTGKWVASTLTWLPFFWLTFALSLGTLPLAQDAWPRIRYVMLSFGLILTWFIIGWLGDRDEQAEWAPFLTLVLSIFMLGVVTYGVAIGEAVGEINGLFLGIALGILLSLATIIANVVGGPITSITSSYVMMIVWIFVTEFLAFGVAFVIALGITFIIRSSWEKSIQTGRSSWLIQAGFLGLLASHIFIIWIAFLGGWSVFTIG